MTIMPRKAAEYWWKIKVPSEIHHYYYNNAPGFGIKPDWKEVTWKDIFQKRKDEQQRNIWLKRYSETTVIKPCFIQVFYNNTTFFYGWWIYIKTLKKDYAINFRFEYSEDLILKTMQLFPCGVFPLMENFDHWAESFAKAYPHKGFKRKKNQGLKKCFCEIDSSGNLKDLFIK